MAKKIKAENLEAKLAALKAQERELASALDDARKKERIERGAAIGSLAEAAGALDLDDEVILGALVEAKKNPSRFLEIGRHAMPQKRMRKIQGVAS